MSELDKKLEEVRNIFFVMNTINDKYLLDMCAKYGIEECKETKWAFEMVCPLDGWDFEPEKIPQREALWLLAVNFLKRLPLDVQERIRAVGKQIEDEYDSQGEFCDREDDIDYLLDYYEVGDKNVENGIRALTYTHVMVNEYLVGMAFCDVICAIMDMKD